jgi:hypothetical protein
VSDTDHGLINVHAIEANRLVVIHGKADGGGIGNELGIGNPGKGLNENDIEGSQIQDRLSHRDLADQRRKLDTELPDGPSEFVDVGEIERLQDRRR